ncbi:MAG: hypothetical protein EOO42_17570 [Flavobacteriales bacterium]|nr:MAG: hypothetical protein EOO42_17570 [Flavobacteriales bacterium]
MGRLFTSKVDQMLYGDEFVALMHQFYDRVDAIQERNIAVLPDGTALDEAFEFHLPKSGSQGIEFNDKYNLPHEIMEEIFKEFQDVFGRKQ